MKKLILTDCDDVLLNWADAFEDFILKEYGIAKLHEKTYDVKHQYSLEEYDYDSWPLIKHFNESANIAFLEPYKDSVEYVKKLHAQYGYKFVVITSFGQHEAALKLRKMNLNNIFGNVFKDIISLDSDKMPTLKNYSGTNYFWIEDKLKNALMGLDVGLRPVLMTREHNESYINNPYEKNSYIHRVHCWRDIYNHIRDYDHEYEDISGNR